MWWSACPEGGAPNCTGPHPRVAPRGRRRGRAKDPARLRCRRTCAVLVLGFGLLAWSNAGTVAEGRIRARPTGSLPGRAARRAPLPQTSGASSTRREEVGTAPSATATGGDLRPTRRRSPAGAFERRTDCPPPSTGGPPSSWTSIASFLRLLCWWLEDASNSQERRAASGGLGGGSSLLLLVSLLFFRGAVVVLWPRFATDRCRCLCRCGVGPRRPIFQK